MLTSWLQSTRVVRDGEERSGLTMEGERSFEAQGQAVFMVAPGHWNGDQPWIAQPYVESQARALVRVGWKVAFGLIDNRTSLRGVARNARRLRAELTEASPAVVHAQYGSVTAALGAWLAGRTPFVVSFCGDDLLGAANPGVTWRVRSVLARQLGLFGAMRASAIIVKSRNLLEALPRPLRRRATILPNGVDLDWFQPLDRDRCRSMLGWDRSATVVLFNASREEDRPGKNPMLAQAAVEIAKRSEPSVSVFMMAKATREEVRLMLNAADCLLVTSVHEGSPNIVKEAMACNLPVVSVPCGDVVERLTTTRTGVVCAYDAMPLARGILEVLRPRRRSDGREQIVAQKLELGQTAERLGTLYLRIGARLPPPLPMRA